MTDACDRTQLALSVTHDEGGDLNDIDAAHSGDCAECRTFSDRLAVLDSKLARGQFADAPGPIEARPRNDGRWLWVAAAGLVGLVLGAVMAGVQLSPIQADELGTRFHSASPGLTTLSADLTIVERGVHPDIPERTYLGTIHYTAPESVSLEMIDTTTYPGPEWVPNDVRAATSDGTVTVSASSTCRLEAMPGCLAPANVVGTTGIRPFDPVVTGLLDVVGPADRFTWWNGLDVLGPVDIDGRATFQLETTVSGAVVVEALTRYGSWREFNPADRVLLWLDAETLAPVRVEVFATAGAERALWAVRRGYEDPTDNPIFVAELSPSHSGVVPTPTPSVARDAGFAELPVSEVDPIFEGFEPHRAGTWSLPDGGVVEVTSWNNGRAWIVVETTAEWTTDDAFGLDGVFARRVVVGDGVGYLDASGRRLSIHSPALDVLVTGSIPTTDLLGLAATLDIVGEEAPEGWTQTGVVGPDGLADAFLVPPSEGWSAIGKPTDLGYEMLLVGAGDRQILLRYERGSEMSLPIGADIESVEVRGAAGRYDGLSGTLEWPEDGRVVRMESVTVSRAELIEVAEALDVGAG